GCGPGGVARSEKIGGFLVAGPPVVRSLTPSPALLSSKSGLPVISRNTPPLHFDPAARHEIAPEPIDGGVACRQKVFHPVVPVAAPKTRPGRKILSPPPPVRS